MKVEAVCSNDGCPTVRENGERFMQLLPADRMNLPMGYAVDEDGNLLECPWCACPMTVVAPARDEAQFALGEIDVSRFAKHVLSWNSESTDPLDTWATPASRLIAMHARGDHGSVTGEVLAENRKWIDANALEATGYIISTYMVHGAPVIVMTNRTRSQTRICLPEEARIDS